MIELPDPIRQTSRFMRTVLRGFWFTSATVMVLVLAGTHLAGRHREVIDHAEQVRELLTASLATPMTSASRQALLQSYATSRRED
jgi:hypothetical protein